MYLKGFLKTKVIQRIFLLLFGICSTNVLFAQGNVKLDKNELLQDLAAEKEDSNKVYILRALAEYYRGRETDSALLFAKKAIALSQESKFELGEALSLSTMGKLYRFLGDYTKALQLYFQSLQITERIKDLNYVVFNYNSIGELYVVQGDYRQALQYFFKGLSIAEKNNFDWQCKLLLSTGKAYEKMGDQFVDGTAQGNENPHAAIDRRGDNPPQRTAPVFAGPPSRGGEESQDESADHRQRHRRSRIAQGIQTAAHHAHHKRRDLANRRGLIIQRRMQRRGEKLPGQFAAAFGRFQVRCSQSQLPPRDRTEHEDAQQQRAPRPSQPRQRTPDIPLIHWRAVRLW